MPAQRKHSSDAARKKAYRDRQRAKKLLREEGMLPEPAPVAASPEAVAEAEAASHEADSPVVEAAVATGSKAVLQAIRDDPKALNADRIRASVELQRMDKEEAQTAGGEQFTGLLAVQRMLETMPPEHRLAYLDKHTSPSPDGGIRIEIEEES